MPTYEYIAAEGQKGCPSCNVGFEVVHRMSEAGPTQCPRCGAAIVRRFTPPGLVTRFNEKATLSDANLKRHGFKTLRNEGGGKFRVT